jgi:hypothetical protein
MRSTVAVVLALAVACCMQDSAPSTVLEPSVPAGTSIHLGKVCVEAPPPRWKEAVTYDELVEYNGGCFHFFGEMAVELGDDPFTPLEGAWIVDYSPIPPHVVRSDSYWVDCGIEACDELQTGDEVELWVVASSFSIDGEWHIGLNMFDFEVLRESQ